jgi:uncharacterized membrane protein
MSPLGQVHFLTALIALVSGAWVLLRRKGTARHRQVGWLYVASMLALNVSALLIYRLTGTFGPFHFAALISLATLLAGVVQARRRLRGDRNWLPRHYFYMTWSYLGLAAAAVAETATRLPALQSVAGGPTAAFWTAVVIASVAVFTVGAMLIRRKADIVIRPFLNR